MPRKGLTVDLKGFEDALRRANALPGLFGKSSAAKRAVRAVAGELKAKVKANAPQGPTGNLKKGVRRSAKPSFIRQAGPLDQFVFVDRRIAPHMHLVEFGHGGQRPAPPHPFFRPAIESSRGTARAAITAGLRAAIVGVSV